MSLINGEVREEIYNKLSISVDEALEHYLSIIAVIESKESA